jgi:hypothetical protein
MHASFVGVGGLPCPGLILLGTVANPIQHIDHILPNRWEKFVAVERSSDGKIQVGQSRIGVFGDQRLLVRGDRVPAKPIIIRKTTTIEDLRQAWPDKID